MSLFNLNSFIMSSLVKKSYAKCVVKSIGLDNYDRPTATVQQVHTKTYPAGSPNNGLSDNMFQGAGEGKSFSSTRTVFYRLPSTLMIGGEEVDTLSEQGKAFITKTIEGGEAHIWQVVSTDINDVITDGQRYHIDQGNLTLDKVKEGARITNMETGEIVCDVHGNEVYRVNNLAQSFKEDQNSVEFASERASAEASFQEGEVGSMND